jgi:hypothetical protein
MKPGLLTASATVSIDGVKQPGTAVGTATGKGAVIVPKPTRLVGQARISAAQAGTVTIAVTARNAGSDPAVDAAVCVTAPSGATVVAPGATVSANQTCWPARSLAAGHRLNDRATIHGAKPGQTITATALAANATATRATLRLSSQRGTTQTL